MRNAAGKLSHRLELLRLHQGGLGVLPLGNLHLQPVVGDQQFARPLGHPGLHRLGVPAQFLLAAGQRAGQIVVGGGDLAELRPLVLAGCARGEVAGTPPTRRLEQFPCRPPDEAPRDKQRDEECTDRDNAQQQAAAQAGPIDVGHQIGLIEADRDHQVIPRFRGGNEAEHALRPIDAPQSHNAGLRGIDHLQRRRRQVLADVRVVRGRACQDGSVAIGQRKHGAGQEARPGLADLLQMLCQPPQVQAGDKKSPVVARRSRGREGQRAGTRNPAPATSHSDPPRSRWHRSHPATRRACRHRSRADRAWTRTARCRRHRPRRRTRTSAGRAGC